MRFSARYTILFATALCLVCSVLVSTVAVSLRGRQQANQKLLGQGRQLLTLAGLTAEGEELGAAEIGRLLFEHLEPRIVELSTGAYADHIDPVAYDQRRASTDPQSSRAAPDNPAQVKRLPRYARIFVHERGGRIDSILLPIEGMGMWSTIYGFLALEADARTIRGIAFYEHEETPGLGAEIDNTAWKKLWHGRLAFDDAGTPKIRVKKGKAGSPQSDPYQVDGISGSTITCDGVTHLVQFWLGDDGFGPYLDRYREQSDAHRSREAAHGGKP